MSDREWSPNGYDRAIELYERHFFDGSHFFRAIPGFLVQFGISYSHDQELQKFAKTAIQDDPKHVPEIHFKPGIISYAGSGPNSRTSQMFISYGSAQSLGTQPWETPLGQVIEGMENAEQFYSYGDMPPWGKGPAQGKIHGHPEYIQNEFPLIDSFVHCKVERFNVSGGVGGNKDTATNKVLKKEDGVSDEETFQKQRQAVDVGANKNEGQEENVHEKVANLNLNPMHHTTGDKKMMGLKGGPEAMGMVETHESATIVVVLAGVVVVGALALIVFLLRSGRKVSSKTS